MTGVYNAGKIIGVLGHDGASASGGVDLGLGVERGGEESFVVGIWWRGGVDVGKVGVSVAEEVCPVCDAWDWGVRAGA